MHIYVYDICVYVYIIHTEIIPQFYIKKKTNAGKALGSEKRLFKKKNL